MFAVFMVNLSVVVFLVLLAIAAVPYIAVVAGLIPGNFLMDPRVALVDKNPSPEVREFAKSFNIAASDLGGIEMMRKGFIDAFSHEFKTPIVSLSGFARMLKEGDLALEQRGGGVSRYHHRRVEQAGGTYHQRPEPLPCGNVSPRRRQGAVQRRRADQAGRPDDGIEMDREAA
jgi:signal transduction histidine kinase